LLTGRRKTSWHLGRPGEATSADPGSGKVLAHDLYPVVAGAGIPAFDPTVFDTAERTASPNGVTLSRLTRC